MLYVRGVAGGQPRRIGRVFGIWSPDSTRLAVSDPRGLFLVDVRTGKRRRLASADVGWLSFAPRGKLLAFSRTNGKVGREYRSDVFVVRLSDLALTRLTHDGHSDRPVWGGSWIVYRSFYLAGDWSIGRLRLMRPDGSDNRAFARGDERTSRAQMGLDPLELSADGKHLLACAAAEFGCPPVTFHGPGREALRPRAPPRAHRGPDARAGDRRRSRPGRARGARLRGPVRQRRRRPRVRNPLRRRQAAAARARRRASELGSLVLTRRGDLGCAAFHRSVP